MVEKSSARPRSFTVDDAGRVRSSVRVSTGTVQDPPPFVASVQETEVDEKAEDSKSTPSGSFSSGQSDDMSVSDEPVTTMADVLSEISRDESGGDVRELRDVAQDAAKEVNLLTAEEPPPLLKRNNTLKWSGSRKAPALIREFTRRQKQQQNVNQEVEATLSSSNRIMVRCLNCVAQRHKQSAYSFFFLFFFFIFLECLKNEWNYFVNWIPDAHRMHFLSNVSPTVKTTNCFNFPTFILFKYRY